MVSKHQLSTISAKGGAAEYGDNKRGVRLDSGPHIGVIKSNSDSTRRGRLRVYISNLRGSEEDPGSWQTVAYSPAFYNVTTGGEGKNNYYKESKHASGLWIPTPDVGSKVLCFFVDGDASQGFWVSCIIDDYNMLSVPGHASVSEFDPNSDTGNEFLRPGGYPARMPVTEFNTSIPGNDPSTLSDWNVVKKPIDIYTARRLKAQGLDSDLVRGHISSSSLRESPSDVFGISTKGRPLTETNLNILSQSGGAEAKAPGPEQGRKPGHSFVMDDGDLEGNDQLIRLRTSSGHQILMNDKEGMIYVGTASGNTWIELSEDGKIDVYSADSVNFRAKEFNFYSETDINMHAKQDINMVAESIFHAEGVQSTVLNSPNGPANIYSASTLNLRGDSGVNMQSNSTMNLKASGPLVANGSCIDLNGGAAGDAEKPTQKPTQTFPDTRNTGGFWVGQTADIQATVTRIPTHEPYHDHAGIIGAQEPGNFSPPLSRVVNPPVSTKGLETVTTVSTTDLLTKSQDIKQPPTNKPIGPLTAEESRKLFAVVGQNESGGDYSAENQIGYIGKYQFGHDALIDLGYIRPDVKKNSEMNDNEVWLGKDGINSKADFFKGEDVQEKIMSDYANINYKQLLNTGGLTTESTNEDVGGMLMTAHLLGAGGATTYRKTGLGEDQNGTKASKYYAIGSETVKNS
tara:strand:+ start:553 stop:2607 length:2055 start_codon:yes stop_codon:yes gene_type:complete